MKRHIASGCRPEGGFHLYEDTSIKTPFRFILTTYGAVSEAQLSGMARTLEAITNPKSEGSDDD